MPREIVTPPRVALLERLEPRFSQRMLMTSVRQYFFRLYNVESDDFRKFLVSVTNADALTGKREFDRLRAVDQIKLAGKEARDQVIIDASEGQIYKCIVALMRQTGQGLKVRRIAQQRLIAQQQRDAAAAGQAADEAE